MYKLVHWKMYNYGELYNKDAVSKKYDVKNKNVVKYSDYIITVDTETSKKRKNDFEMVKGRKKWNSYKNYVVAFTVTIRYKHENIVTLYGNRPDECIECLHTLKKCIYGDKIFMFIFNLPYDYVFLRKFMFAKWGTPDNQLNIDPHYPISIEFGRLIFRDALVLAQRKLEKWAADLNVETQKESGWDYSKIRTQHEDFTIEELRYIEADTKSMAECIDKVLMTLGCKLKDIPFTATGIARRDAYKKGKKNKAKYLYQRIHLTYDQYLKFEKSFHGGYTHVNRFFANVKVLGVECQDENSAYPTQVCANKFPMTKFINLRGYYTPEEILSTHDKYAYMFKITMINVHLTDPREQMPVLQVSKNLSNIRTKEMTIDNGRILDCPVYEGYMNDIDLELVMEQYKADYIVISELMRSEYDYLPRWFTDHVYQLYKDKCMLKGGDPVLYDITKMKLNSVAYGMLAMRNIKEEIIEDYATGEFSLSEDESPADIYERFINNRRSIYPYQWCCWVTSYAQQRLFALGKCCKNWIYSDTDSCFSDSWDQEKLKVFNEDIKKKLHDNGYDPIVVNGKEYCLGAACLDKSCDEFKALHSKCYAYTDSDGMHITIAGVPKKAGAKLLKTLDDLQDWKIFDGEITKKLTHVYHMIDKITVEDGIIYGDSIDLIPCDYCIKPTRMDDIIANYDKTEEIVNEMFTRHVYSRMKTYE